MGKLDGKVALITGGASGIGKATPYLFDGIIFEILFTFQAVLVKVMALTDYRVAGASL